MANSITIDDVLYEQKTPEGPFEPVKPAHTMEDAFRFKSPTDQNGAGSAWPSDTVMLKQVMTIIDKYLVDGTKPGSLGRWDSILMPAATEIIHLIDSDRDKAQLEARIDEWKKAYPIVSEENDQLWQQHLNQLRQQQTGRVKEDVK